MSLPFKKADTNPWVCTKRVCPPRRPNRVQNNTPLDELLSDMKIDERLTFGSWIRALRASPGYAFGPEVRYETKRAMKYIESGSLDLLKTLIKKQPQVMKLKHTLLETAIKFSKVPIILFLFKEAAKLSFTIENEPENQKLYLLLYGFCEEQDTQEHDLTWVMQDKKLTEGILHIAAYHGNLSVIMQLAQCTNDLSISSLIYKNGTSLLHSTCRGFFAPKLEVDYSTLEDNKLKLAQWLDEKRLCIKVKDKNGWTPLHMAASADQLDLVKWLVKVKKMDVHAVDINGKKAHHVAAFHGCHKTLEWLLEEYKIDVNNDKDSLGWPLLHFAVAGNQKTITDWLITDKKANIKTIDVAERNILHIAAHHGHLDLVMYLLQIQGAGLDLNIRYKHKRSVLHAICRKYDEKWNYLDDIYLPVINVDPNEMEDLKLKVLQYLIDDCGADFRVLDEFQWNLIHMAASSNYMKLVDYLLTKGIDIDAKEDVGRTALHNAARLGSLKVVMYLVQKGADVNARDKFNQTPAHWAYRILREKTPLLKHALPTKDDKLQNLINKQNCLKWLIENGTNINAKGKNDLTLLHNAAERDDLSTFCWLIENKADMHSRDAFGNTPVKFCKVKNKRRSAIIQWLENRGSRI